MNTSEYEPCNCMYIIFAIIVVIRTAPDIRALSNSLRVSLNDLSGGGVAVDIIFTVSTRSQSVYAEYFVCISYDILFSDDTLESIYYIVYII